MSARALHDYTDLLPLISMSELGVTPPALGTATISAMRSGLFWGAVGAMRELITRLDAGLPAAQVFLTGGAAPAVAHLLAAPDGRSTDYVPHLTLGGVALAGSGR
jgi:type III pantothenate kinase